MPSIILRRANNFPVTRQEPIALGDPKAEPTRDEVNAHPENPYQQLERTRRYFRLLHRPHRARTADLGDEWHFEAR